MSERPGIRSVADQGDDCELQARCPYAHDVVGTFIRAETGWCVTNDKIKLYMSNADAVVVSGTSKKSPGELIAVTIALPTETPFIPTSPAYYVPLVVVAGSHRRKGIGHRIVREVIRICEDERRSVEILPQQQS